MRSEDDEVLLDVFVTTHDKTRMISDKTRRATASLVRKSKMSTVQDILQIKFQNEAHLWGP